MDISYLTSRLKMALRCQETKYYSIADALRTS